MTSVRHIPTVPTDNIYFLEPLIIIINIKL